MRLGWLVLAPLFEDGVGRWGRRKRGDWLASLLMMGTPVRDVNVSRGQVRKAHMEVIM